jgi:uncharacterized protein
MNKILTKSIIWVGIPLILVVAFTSALYWGYRNIYLPYCYSSLYEEGLSNLEKADSIADELSLLGQYETAIRLLTKAAESGVVKSQTKLALYLDSYDKDLEKSSYWYLQAALNEDSDAQCHLGLNYLNGWGVAQNFEKAIYWIEKSASNNNRWGQYELGNLYLNGLAYYDLDYEHTNFWYTGNNTFRDYENTSYKVSNRELSKYLNNPKKVFLSPDLSKAKYYWNLAAKQGEVMAKDALEKIYD